MRPLDSQNIVNYKLVSFSYLTLDFFTRQAFFNKDLSNISDILVPIRIVSDRMAIVDLID